MIITALEYGKDKLFNIYVDGQFLCKVDDMELYNLELSRDMLLSEELKEKLLISSEWSIVKKDAARLISRKAYSELELRRKLKQKGNSDQMSSKVVEWLRGKGYIDDYNYASNYIKDAINIKGDGIAKITYNLKQKGINSYIIEELLQDNRENEAENLNTLVEKYVANIGELDRKNIEKIKRRLYSKGYKISDIITSINNYVDEYWEE